TSAAAPERVDAQCACRPCSSWSFSRVSTEQKDDVSRNSRTRTLTMSSNCSQIASAVINHVAVLGSKLCRDAGSRLIAKKGCLRLLVNALERAKSTEATGQITSCHLQQGTTSEIRCQSDAKCGQNKQLKLRARKLRECKRASGCTS